MAAVVIAFGASSAWGLTEQEAKLLAADGFPNQFLGRSVALDGDTAVVGAPGGISGSAYVFTRTAGVWTEQAKLTAPDGELGDSLGQSVALDGDTAVVGAFRDDDNGSDSGSA